MASLPSKRKRDSSPTPPNVHVSTAQSTNTISALSVPDDDDSTDFKLALLASLQPDVTQDVLLDILLDCEGSVEKAAEWLTRTSSIPHKKTIGVLGQQTSLAGFVSTSSVKSKAKLLSRKGRTLHLYSPEDVAQHTPCSIIHNFLPAQTATDLLEELLLESKTYEPMTFKLFDNVVQSPHTACFYVGSYEEMSEQKTEYLYNGAILTDIRTLTPHMQAVAPTIQATVQDEIQKRIASHYPNGEKLQYQSSAPWSPNAVFANCYRGGQESVGYHSDQLTYLGPRAVIASLSLGVAREFRVRRIIPVDDSIPKAERPSSEANLEGQISIHLPHNSLLIMHAEMQEEWKHSIAPAATIEPHPIAGNTRINITYRDYKKSLHPSLTPKCRCGIPCVLRVVQRKKENWGRYFWMCHAGNVPGKEGCTFFEWARFDDEGEPVWGNNKISVGNAKKENGRV